MCRFLINLSHVAIKSDWVRKSKIILIWFIFLKCLTFFEVSKYSSSSFSLSSFGSGSLQSDTVIPPSVSSVSTKFIPTYSNDSKQYSYGFFIDYCLKCSRINLRSYCSFSFRSTHSNSSSEE